MNLQKAEQLFSDIEESHYEIVQVFQQVEKTHRVFSQIQSEDALIVRLKDVLGEAKKLSELMFQTTELSMEYAKNVVVMFLNEKINGEIIDQQTIETSRNEERIRLRQVALFNEKIDEISILGQRIQEAYFQPLETRADRQRAVREGVEDIPPAHLSRFNDFPDTIEEEEMGMVSGVGTGCMDIRFDTPLSRVFKMVMPPLTKQDTFFVLGHEFKKYREEILAEAERVGSVIRGLQIVEFNTSQSEIVAKLIKKFPNLVVVKFSSIASREDVEAGDNEGNLIYPMNEEVFTLEMRDALRTRERLEFVDIRYRRFPISETLIREFVRDAVKIFV